MISKMVSVWLHGKVNESNNKYELFANNIK